MENRPPKRPHPLEVPPPPRPNPATNPVPQTILRIPVVKPYATYGLIALNCLIFLIRALSPQLDEQIHLWGASNHDLVLRLGETYRLFSAMFLHSGIYDQRGSLELSGSLHLLINMYSLWIVGANVERLFGHARYLVIYLLGGVAGSVLSALFNEPNVYSVGASGAIFAIIGAELVYLYHQRNLFGAAGRARRSQLVLIALMNFVFGFISSTSGGSSIDNFGHLGGFLGGLALTWFLSPILHLHPVEGQPNEIMAVDINPLRQRYHVVVIYLALLLLMLFVGVAVVRG